jgi:uncharacterized RDD family membrane protein YckC
MTPNIDDRSYPPGEGRRKHMAQCATCSAEAPAGIRWCGICHANVVDPAVGRLASPGRRLAAHVCDVAIPVAAFVTVVGVAGVGAASGSEAGFGLGGLTAFALLVAYVVWALKLFSHGTTPGKNALGMRVVTESGVAAGFGAMLLREWIGKWLSSLVLGLGFLWILFDRDRQGWHDKLGTTYVVQS